MKNEAFAHSALSYYIEKEGIAEKTGRSQQEDDVTFFMVKYQHQIAFSRQSHSILLRKIFDRFAVSSKELQEIKMQLQIFLNRSQILEVATRNVNIHESKNVSSRSSGY